MAIPSLCLFEDDAVSRFYPLTDTRHVSDLLVGTETLRQRAIRRLRPDSVVLHARTHLRGVVESRGDSLGPIQHETLFLNGRCIVGEDLARRLSAEGEWIMTSKRGVVACRLSASNAARVRLEPDVLRFDPLDEVRVVADVDDLLPEALWDLIHANFETIVTDMADRVFVHDGVVHPSVVMVYPEAIYLGHGSEVHPGAVIDATDGPVVIASGARIMHGAVVLGPAYIGESTIVKVLSKIYPGTTIGRSSKVGGEVEASIVIGWANKQHDGFVGHSYVGAWVNLGADTNTSDLKNNYGTVRVSMRGVEVNTGRMMVGALIGDHVKTGINSMLNTGTVIGTGANVFGAGYPAREIERFAWGSDGRKFRIDEAVELARTVMLRRGVTMSEMEERLLRYLHALESNFPTL